MTALILGLLIFIGTHSIRICADDWRTAQIASKGEKMWKGLYAAASLLGFALIVWGYGQSRAAPVDLWAPPLWTHYMTSILMLPAFALIVAAYVRGNHLKATLGHPMLAGAKTWAFAHLLSNGRLGDVILFGVFLIWAAACFASSRRRDRAAATQYPAGTIKSDAIVVIIAAAAWLVFAHYLHAPLIGVAVF